MARLGIFSLNKSSPQWNIHPCFSVHTRPKQTHEKSKSAGVNDPIKGIIKYRKDKNAHVWNQLNRSSNSGSSAVFAYQNIYRWGKA